MQIIHLEDSPALQTARKLILYSIVASIVLALCCIALLGMQFFLRSIWIEYAIAVVAVINMAAFIVGMVGLYKFSKLANTFIFKLVCFSVLFSAVFMTGEKFLLPLIGSNFGGLLLSIMLFGIIYFPLQIYWAYLIFYEFYARTKRKEFVIAFWFGAAVFTIALISITVSLFVIVEPYQSYGSNSYLYGSMYGQMDSLLNSYYARMDYAMQMEKYIAVLGCVAVFCACANILFLMLCAKGINDTKEISIKENNKIKLEKREK